MGMMLTVFAILLPGSTATSPTTRIRDTWPAAKLTGKSELIVIAKLAKTEDSPKTDKISKQYEQMIGINSTFSVLAVVKGRYDKKEMTLLHFRNPTQVGDESPRPARGADGKIIKTSWTQQNDIDPPELVDLNWLKEKNARFLMFLKRRPDGRFECISGQIDPVLSVSKLVGDSDDR